MSALDGWIDVCRTGHWRDSAGRDVPVDEAMLDGIVEAHRTQDPVPVVVGHPATDAPAYAWVSGARRQGDRLQVQLRDVMPAFREAAEGGRYAGRSIAVAGGKLRHVGFLGGRAPAVPGLAPTQFSAEAETMIAFSVGEDGELAMPEPLAWAVRLMADIARGFREDIIAEKGIEAADERIPSWRIDELQRAADEAADASAYASPKHENRENRETEIEEEPGMTGTPDKPDEAALAERQRKLDEREAGIAAREAEAKKAAQLSAAEVKLRPHLEAGRLLPAECGTLAEPGDLMTLVANLSDGAEGFAFSAPTGRSPLAILEALFAAIPARVPYGEHAGGPLPAAAGGSAPSNAAIAAEAEALMSESPGRLTHIEAVDAVRAKHGLPKEGAA